MLNVVTRVISFQQGICKLVLCRLPPILQVRYGKLFLYFLSTLILQKAKIRLFVCLHRTCSDTTSTTNVIRYSHNLSSGGGQRCYFIWESCVVLAGNTGFQDPFLIKRSSHNYFYCIVSAETQAINFQNNFYLIHKVRSGVALRSSTYIN